MVSSKALVFVALVVAAVGSLGSPLITRVATDLDVSLAAAQWTLTVTLLSGAVATPVLGRLGAGPHRREAILVTLGVVAVGSLLTVVPLPFALLLVGRAAQGVGLGLTALMMGVARDHLPAERSARVIALVSVASTIGIGVGYPLAGLLTEVAGLRTAYGLGLVVSLVALGTAWRHIPAAPTERHARVDVVGAVLLAGGLTALLVDVSQTRLWTHHPVVAIGIGVVAVVLLGCWVAWERRQVSPLVDLRLLRLRAVAAANVTMFLGGIGMYLLLTLITRYAQTPSTAGYGFGLSVFQAGLILVPFSALGFVAGKLNAPLGKRFGARGLLSGGAIAVLAACLLFATARGHLIELVLAMALLGFGVGIFMAAMPSVILAVTPADETSSAMAVNQVVRSVGFSLGSALGGLVLAAHTPVGQLVPTGNGYTVAALLGVTALAVTAVSAWWS
jgi:predicted MFS family arabinose efflux permease